MTEKGEGGDDGAGNGTRTRDPNLGKVVLYQLSYSRPGSARIVMPYEPVKPRGSPADRSPGSPSPAVPGVQTPLRPAMWSRILTAMITSISIENLRGIHRAEIATLAPLTILTGPNGCGKSTVLDALLIATSPTPDEAIGRAVQRHSTVIGGSRWLFGDHHRVATLGVTTHIGSRWQRELRWFGHCNEGLRKRLLDHHDEARPPFSTIRISEDKYADNAATSWAAFEMENRFVGESSGVGLTTVRFVGLVDPGRPVRLHRTFAEVARSGRREAVEALLGDLVARFEQLEILVDDDDTPSLYLRSQGRSIPVGLAGDGVQSFVQLALEIAVDPEGLVLLEEPEVYQHPKAIWRTAQALLANFRRGVQLVISTHSLELIDALLAEAKSDELEHLALFNLRLEGGQLDYSRHAGEELVTARQTLENDLR